MDNINEAPVVAAATKVVAGLAKAGAKAAAKGGKAAAKTSKNVGKAVSKMKRPNIKSYKDPKTGKVNLDKYRSDQAAYKKTKKMPDMSNLKPDGVDKKTSQATLDSKKDRRDDKVSDTASNIKKKVDAVTNPVGTLAKKAGNVAKKSTSAVSGAFGTSSFSKESKITFKQFIDKTP